MVNPALKWQSSPAKLEKKAKILIMIQLIQVQHISSSLEYHNSISVTLPLGEIYKQSLQFHIFRF
jgi:hypothetical protein